MLEDSANAWDASGFIFDDHGPPRRSTVKVGQAISGMLA